MENCYNLNKDAIDDFKRYHGIKTDKDVAALLKITPAYLAQLLKGYRGLNEPLRLRFQMITRKSQDQLFLPDFKALPFSHQSFAMAKYYGVMPYSEFSSVGDFRQREFGEDKTENNGIENNTGKEETQVQVKPDDPRQDYFRAKRWWSKNI